MIPSLKSKAHHHWARASSVRFLWRSIVIYPPISSLVFQVVSSSICLMQLVSPHPRHIRLRQQEEDN